MTSIDFNAPADLYPCRRYAKSLARYRRFATAVEAVRYAIEDMPRAWLVGTFLDIDGTRFDGAGIRGLYDAPQFALARSELAA